jgi:hypothetical protein
VFHSRSEDTRNGSKFENLLVPLNAIIMEYENVIPSKSIGMFIIGEPISALRRRLSVRGINVEIKSSDYTNQLSESTILVDGEVIAKLIFSTNEAVIMIEYFNNGQALLYNGINVFGSSYKELKKFGKKNKYAVSDVDMGFMWKKVKMGFFFEEQDIHRCPDSVTIFTSQYEDVLEQSLSEFEENIDLSIVGNNKIRPNQSIGDFFLGESLFLVKFRFDSKAYKFEIVSSIESNNTKSCFIYKKNKIIAQLDFSEEGKVERIKNYKSPLYYGGKNLSNESYDSINEMGVERNYLIEETSEGFTWSNLGISFYFKGKKGQSLPEAIGIHKI